MAANLIVCRAYDDESCDVVRFFTQLKCRMMPYLYREAARANAGYADDAGHDDGVPGRSGFVITLTVNTC